MKARSTSPVCRVQNHTNLQSRPHQIASADQPTLRAAAGTCNPDRISTPPGITSRGWRGWRGEVMGGRQNGVFTLSVMESVDDVVERKFCRWDVGEVGQCGWGEAI